MHWIIGIFMGFMALLSHQTATTTVSTPVPVIIEAPKGVVTHAREYTAPTTADVRSDGNGAATSFDPVSPAVATTSFINPNQSFMDVHEPEGTVAPEPVEVTEVETKPEYITPPAADEPLNGNGYSTGGY